jgi:hypothetical protein
MRSPLLLGIACLGGCGGGMPLLHGAHVLHDREVALGAGFSGTFATGEPSDVALRARQGDAANPEGAMPQAVDAARATAVLMTMSPAVAPWVNARIGLRNDNEVGLTYSGRAIRADVRHAFYDDSVAWSVGAGASWVAAVPGDEPPGAANLRLDWRSAGVDVPLLVGWRSTAGIVMVWGGTKAGFERVAGDVVLAGPEGTPSSHLELHRWYASAVVGLGFGFRHVHGAIELDATYQDLSGSAGPYDVVVRGVTLAPAAGLVATF